MTLVSVHCPELGRPVWLRSGTSDVTVYNETFSGLYHVPPDWMPVPSTVLDLGANIGLTAAHYKSMWPGARVVAVEPDPGNAELARRNAPGVEVFEVAVSWKAGRARLEGDQEYARQVRYDRDGDVRVVTLADLCADAGVDRFDFVKMDVEGYEWSLFTFMDEVCSSLLVELHGARDDHELLSDAQGTLSDLGFVSQPHRVHPRAVFAWRP